MGDWTLVYSASTPHEAELVRGRLEVHDIPTVLMDQRPSIYPSMGTIDVLVGRNDVLRALHVLNTQAEP